MIRKLLFTLLLPGLAVQAQSVPSNTGNCLNAQEAEVATLINAYRIANGLAPIAVSHSLSATGQWHAWDLTANNPVGGSCNMHSWSGTRPTQWNGVCYGSAASAAGMWNKPREISTNLYNSNGYEIAAADFGTITPAVALTTWQNSPLHSDVILNRGVWGGQVWRSMGVGLVAGYAVVWFGTLVDPAGTMAPCQSGGGPIDNVFDNGLE